VRPPRRLQRQDAAVNGQTLPGPSAAREANLLLRHKRPPGLDNVQRVPHRVLEHGNVLKAVLLRGSLVDLPAHTVERSRQERRVQVERGSRLLEVPEEQRIPRAVLHGRHVAGKEAAAGR
jgi:hypothetical protein